MKNKCDERREKCVEKKWDMQFAWNTNYPKEEEEEEKSKQVF